MNFPPGHSEGHGENAFLRTNTPYERARHFARPRLGRNLILSMVVVVVVSILSMSLFTAWSFHRQFARLSPETTALLEQARPELERAGGALDGGFLRSILAAAVVSAAAGTLLALLAARRLARPIEAVSAAAARVARGDLSARAPLSASDAEIAMLAHTFNQMTESLARLEEERKNMIADIAHELRTPLAILQARLDALEDGVLPLDAPQISQLSRQSELLTRLVDDLRTLSLADAGRLSIRREDTDLALVAREVLGGFADRAEKGGQLLTLYVAPDLPRVPADPDRLAQVLSNLLDNALRYTPRGGAVHLEVDRAGPFARLRVADNGPGLSGEDRPRVFDRFYRASASGARDRASGGSGLGLAIVRALTELHGGRVHALNAPQGGAQFEVELPLGGALRGGEGEGERPS